jgi:hypothetical protein
VPVSVELAPPAPLVADTVTESAVVELTVDPSVGSPPVVVPPLSELETPVVVTEVAIEAAGDPALVTSPPVVLVPEAPVAMAEIVLEARMLLPVV